MKILSYNIACMPRIINFFGKPCDRIDRLNIYIYKQRPDIFCLQEVFSSGTLKSINDYFKEKYYIYSYNDTYISLDSGLLIASKYPIFKKKAHIFKHSYGEDKLSSKGVLVVDIIINNKRYSILNTHLNADPIFGFKKKANNVREKQINQLRSIIRQKKRNDINNIYDEWPKPVNVIERRLKSKFGNIRNAYTNIHHYTHIIKKYDITETTYKFIDDKIKRNEFKPVSEYEYMMDQNDKNRKIRLLRPMHITNFIITLQETYNLYG